jgi:hypothetical protein
MNRTLVPIALFASFILWPVSAAAGQQSAADNPPACSSTTTLDDLVKALDEAVSGPANKDRTCLRQVMLPDARLSPVGRSQDGGFSPHILTVDGWIDAVAKRGSTSFYERQVKVDKQQYGHIAHLWCSYEIRPTPDGEATVRGVNSIQAVFDGTRWRVLAVLWDSETTAATAPDKKAP